MTIHAGRNWRPGRRGTRRRGDRGGVLRTPQTDGSSAIQEEPVCVGAGIQSFLPAPETSVDSILPMRSGDRVAGGPVRCLVGGAVGLALALTLPLAPLFCAAGSAPDLRASATPRPPDLSLGQDRGTVAPPFQVDGIERPVPVRLSGEERWLVRVDLGAADGRPVPARDVRRWRSATGAVSSGSRATPGRFRPIRAREPPR